MEKGNTIVDSTHGWKITDDWLCNIFCITLRSLIVKDAKKNLWNAT